MRDYVSHCVRDSRAGIPSHQLPSVRLSDRYVHVANLYLAWTGSERRLQLRTYQSWFYRISSLVLFLMLSLMLFCYLLATIRH
jgi:hypothetical protein